MSAYKRFDTIQFRNVAILLAALKALGYEAKIGKSLPLYGYEGHVRPERAQIVISRDQIGEASNDLGFAWNGQAFTPIISEFDARKTLTEEWRQQLQRTYSKCAVLKFLDDRGANVQSFGIYSQGMVIEATMEVTS